MTAREAALEYHRLDVEGAVGAAGSFARAIEDGATAEDFDEYLRVIDIIYGSN